MKIEITKKVFILLLVLFSLNKGAKAQNVNIPDAKFKSYLLNFSSINTNSDGEISVEEAAAYTGAINVNSLSISNLIGIEAFTALTELYCAWNPLTTLNVSANTNLTGLWCQSTSLTNLDVTANTKLTTLVCHSNSLTSLDVSKITNLEYLDCYSNQLTSLDISANINLTKLSCIGNLLTYLNVSANTKITDLNCHNNLLTSLDVSANTNLTILFCGANSLDHLDISANTNLKYINCESNQLTNLDVSANTALTYLGCFGNLLTNLDVSANTALTTLDCNSNSLTSLDVSVNINLTELYCQYNSLIRLNVKNGNNTNLTYFNAKYNPYLLCILVDSAEYMAANWSNGKDNTASFNDIRCPFTIIATVLPAYSGVISGAGNYYSGDNVSLTATANTGFTFTNWTENGAAVSTSANYSFTANDNKILVANFKPNSYTIAASVLPTNSGNIEGLKTYNYGEIVSLKATANTGFSFINWTENGSIVSMNSSYIFWANTDRVLVANFMSTVGISDCIESNALIIYPNPNRGQMVLNLDDGYYGEITIRIYSTIGTIIKELKEYKTADKISYPIDLVNIANGTYYVTVTTIKGKSGKAILIMK